MSMEKRFLVFLLLSLALMVGSQALVAVLWPKKPRPAADPAIAALEEAEKTKAQAADLRAGDEKAKSGEEESPASDTPAPKAAIADSNTPPRTEVPEPAIIAGEELILGSLEDASGTGYRLRASLSQEGAGVGRIESAIYKAESPTNRRPTEPLELIQPNPLEAPSFATVIPYDAAGTLRRSTQSHDGKALHELVDASEAVQAYVVLPPQWDLSRLLDRRVGVRGTSSSVEGLSARLITDIRRMDWLDQDGLDRRPWEVVRDDAGRIVRPVIVEGRETGQEVVFRTTIDDPAVTIAKRFRLLMGSDALEMSLSFASAPGAKAAQAISYQIFGPHRVPIEGEWYTGTFRDVFIAQADGAGTKIETRSAADVAKAAGAPERFQALPLLFAGVENQYFAVFLRPEDVPEDPAARWDAETVPTVVEVDPQQPHKADVTVTILSKPVVLEPGAERTFTYSIYAGPKTAANLSLFAAEDLASYRKGWQIPILGPLGASLARGVIAPLLGQIYKFTESVARVFGGTRGNYGVAIILLTVLVRLLLFPLSRKQAIMAKKMQEIQPLLNELKEKHKDDKEKFAREMMRVQRENGVNMFGGCLPALIQLPIFIGLWQALNNSVSLRQAPFVLWIQNLAAPDMLFRLPFEIPILSGFLGPYFNVLPIFVMLQMMLQMKLFSPPATTEEQKVQQQTMKYMMIFMGFMFYKVPSGLGIYFITSSGWAIAERLLLPKTLKSKPIVRPQDAEEEGEDRGVAVRPKPAPKPGGNGSNGAKPAGWRERMMEQLQKIQEEAEHTRTHRNTEKEAPEPRRPRRGGPSRGRPRRPRD